MHLFLAPCLPFKVGQSFSFRPLTRVSFLFEKCDTDSLHSSPNFSQKDKLRKSLYQNLNEDEVKCFFPPVFSQLIGLHFCLGILYLLSGSHFFVSGKRRETFEVNEHPTLGEQTHETLLAFWFDGFAGIESNSTTGSGGFSSTCFSSHDTTLVFSGNGSVWKWIYFSFRMNSTSFFLCLSNKSIVIVWPNFLMIISLPLVY